jgi:hypothetical protein
MEAREDIPAKPVVLLKLAVFLLTFAILYGSMRIDYNGLLPFPNNERLEAKSIDF